MGQEQQPSERKSMPGSIVPTQSGQVDEKPNGLLYEIVGKLPLVSMLLLGTATVCSAGPDSFWNWICAASYLGYAAVAVTWFTVSACPRRRAKVAESVEPRKDSRTFWAGLAAIVPLWIFPPLAAVVALYLDFSWLVTILVLAFAVDSFVVLPLVARLYVCARCDQKTNCPWMGNAMGQPTEKSEAG
jgi:hypothetical protein